MADYNSPSGGSVTLPEPQGTLLQQAIIDFLHRNQGFTSMRPMPSPPIMDNGTGLDYGIDRNMPALPMPAPIKRGKPLPEARREETISAAPERGVLDRLRDVLAPMPDYAKPLGPQLLGTVMNQGLSLGGAFIPKILITLAKAGNPAAMAELFGGARMPDVLKNLAPAIEGEAKVGGQLDPIMRGASRRMTMGRPQDYEDAMQVARAAALESLAKFNPEGNTAFTSNVYHRAIRDIGRQLQPRAIELPEEVLGAVRKAEQLKAKIYAKEGIEPSIEALAAGTGIHVDRLRDAYRFADMPVQWNELANSPVPFEAGPARLIKSATGGAEMQQALSGLTAQQRNVYELSLGGKSQVEIAKELGINQSAVSRHIAAAKARLGKGQ